MPSVNILVRYLSVRGMDSFTAEDDHELTAVATLYVALWAHSLRHDWQSPGRSL